jgi:hypothetical protein
MDDKPVRRPTTRHGGIARQFRLTDSLGEATQWQVLSNLGADESPPEPAGILMVWKESCP